MKIMNEKFVISTKDFPLKFSNASGEYEDNIEDARFYYSAQDADYMLRHSFDEPEKHRVIKVDVTYEF